MGYFYTKSKPGLIMGVMYEPLNWNIREYGSDVVIDKRSIRSNKNNLVLNKNDIVSIEVLILDMANYAVRYTFSKRFRYVFKIITRNSSSYFFQCSNRDDFKKKYAELKTSGYDLIGKTLEDLNIIDEKLKKDDIVSRKILKTCFALFILSLGISYIAFRFIDHRLIGFLK